MWFGMREWVAVAAAFAAVLAIAVLLVAGERRMRRRGAERWRAHVRGAGWYGSWSRAGAVRPG